MSDPAHTPAAAAGELRPDGQPRDRKARDKAHNQRRCRENPDHYALVQKHTGLTNAEMEMYMRPDEQSPHDDLVRHVVNKNSKFKAEYRQQSAPAEGGVAGAGPSAAGKARGRELEEGELQEKKRQRRNAAHLTLGAPVWVEETFAGRERRAVHRIRELGLPLKKEVDTPSRIADGARVGVGLLSLADGTEHVSRRRVACAGSRRTLPKRSTSTCAPTTSTKRRCARGARRSCAAWRWRRSAGRRRCNSSRRGSSSPKGR